MRTRLVDLKPHFWVRIASVVVLTLLLSAWSTCSFDFQSCQGVGQQAQIASLSPDTVPGDAEFLLTVNGTGFTPKSQILWNGSDLPTIFADSHHLQTTITQETFAFFGGSSGSSVPISVRSQGSGGGCPPNGNSAAHDLLIN